MDRMFKSLCCVVHYLVQDDFIGMYKGLFEVIAWWCILESAVICIWIVCSHCMEVYIGVLKIVALRCMMDCSQ